MLALVKLLAAESEAGCILLSLDGLLLVCVSRMT